MKNNQAKAQGQTENLDAATLALLAELETGIDPALLDWDADDNIGQPKY